MVVQTIANMIEELTKMRVKRKQDRPKLFKADQNCNRLHMEDFKGMKIRVTPNFTPVNQMEGVRYDYMVGEQT